MGREFLFSRAAIGEMLKRARRALGLSLRDLSAKCGVSAGHLLRIESGEFNIPLEKLVTIAMALNIPVGMVLETGLRANPGFYVKALGEFGIADLMPRDAQQRKDRGRLEIFYAGCCVALSALLKSSNAERLVQTISFPFDELRHTFSAEAKKIDVMHWTDRSSIITDLDLEPLEILKARHLASKELSATFLKLASAATFTGQPDQWKLLE